MDLGNTSLQEGGCFSRRDFPFPFHLFGFCASSIPKHPNGVKPGWRQEEEEEVGFWPQPKGISVPITTRWCQEKERGRKRVEGREAMGDVEHRYQIWVWTHLQTGEPGLAMRNGRFEAGDFPCCVHREVAGFAPVMERLGPIQWVYCMMQV